MPCTHWSGASINTMNAQQILVGHVLPGCSGYRGLTVVHNSNQLVQVWRQRNLEANRHTMTCQVSDLSQGLPYDHCPYSTVIDKVRVSMLGVQAASNA